MKSLKMPSECKGLTVTVNRELTYHFHKAWMMANGISIGHISTLQLKTKRTNEDSWSRTDDLLLVARLWWAL